MDDDAELIERYLGGEKRAGSLLVARHSGALFCWLRWKTGSREEAEDLTQLVWMRAFPALPRLEDHSALRAWLFAIMRREFGHWLRDHRAACSLDTLGETIDGLAASMSPDAIRAVEDRIELQNALAQLSEEHRDTFMLRYLSQFTAPEVARILEVPVGTVESRCHFARQRLRELMQRSDAPTAIKNSATVLSNELRVPPVAETGRGIVPAPANVAGKNSAGKRHWFKGNWK